MRIQFFHTVILGQKMSKHVTKSIMYLSQFYVQLTYFLHISNLFMGCSVSQKCHVAVNK